MGRWAQEGGAGGFPYTRRPKAIAILRALQRRTAQLKIDPISRIKRIPFGSLPRRDGDDIAPPIYRAQ